MQGHDDPEISAALKDAERAGFRLMLFGHTAILAVTAAGFTYGYWLYGNASGLILTLLSLGLGILSSAPWEPCSSAPGTAMCSSPRMCSC